MAIKKFYGSMDRMLDEKGRRQERPFLAITRFFFYRRTCEPFAADL